MSNLDKIFEALSSATRRRILAYLSETELAAGQIADRFDMSKPSISKHLHILETANLIKSTKKGQFVYYALVRDNLVAGMYDYLTNFCPISRKFKQESQKLAKKMQKG